MNSIKVLFLAANPKQTSTLALDEELREITQKIRLSDGRDVLNVISTWAVRPDDLLQYLNQHKPQVVHFSGHGSSSGEIILVDNNGNARAITSHALKALFSTLKDNIEIVILNACYSEIQGQAISELIDFVIGMNAAIGDQAARVFAASFYRALGFNRTIQEAFDQAKTAIMLEGISEENIPMLLVREGADPNRRIDSTHQTALNESEIIKSKGKKRSWLATQLLHEVGHNYSKNCWRTTREDRQGMLIYGPYVTLSKGDYLAIFELKLETTDNGYESVAELDICGFAGKMIITKIFLTSDNLKIPSKFYMIKLPFSIDETVTNIEFRVRHLGNSTLVIRRVTVDSI